MFQKPTKKSVSSLISTFVLVALSSHGAAAGAGSGGLKGKITATAIIDGSIARQIVATAQPDGSLTNVIAWETSEGAVTQVTFDPNFADLRGTVVTPGEKFKYSFEGGWGYYGQASFGQKGVQYDLGMVSDSRGALRTLVVEKGFNQPAPLQYGSTQPKCTFVDSGDDAGTEFIPASCQFSADEPTDTNK